MPCHDACGSGALILALEDSQKKPCVKRLGESTESNGDEPFFAIAKPFEFFTKHSHICGVQLPHSW